MAEIFTRESISVALEYCEQIYVHCLVYVLGTVSDLRAHKGTKAMTESIWTAITKYHKLKSI